MIGKHLTEYQAALLVRGHSEGFFLGAYKVLELIAKGRMAGVYKAVNESGQSVAIKVLPASKAKDTDILARFKREGRLLTQLEHPNIVRAFQVGESDGKHYLVLEYLDGDTLEEILEKRKKLPPPEAVHVIHQALLGLQHLHGRGMIHRDLKPSNLMLVESATKKGGDILDRAVKILDIGLGKAVFEEGAALTGDLNKLTADGTLIGTPDYLAPEQARNAKSVDIRADVYSLGCVLYHVLTGQPPFPDKSVLNQVMRHANEAPRPLSDFLPEVPDGLQIVMSRLMAKDPAQRYATPEQAAKALAVFLRPATPARPAASPLPDYVKWLEKDAAAAPPKNPAAGIRVGKLESSARKSETPRPPEPRKADVAPAQPVPADFDVELVPLPGPVQPDERKRGLLELNRRDVIMLCSGGGLVVLAALAGWGVSRALRRDPPADPNPTEPAPADPKSQPEG